MPGGSSDIENTTFSYVFDTYHCTQELSPNLLPLLREFEQIKHHRISEDFRVDKS